MDSENIIDDVKKAVLDSLKENDLILKIYKKNQTFEEEIKRFDELIGQMQVKIEQPPVFNLADDIKEIPSKYMEIENIVKSIYTSIEQLKSSDYPHETNTNKEQSSSKWSVMTVKDQIKSVLTKVKANDERIDKVGSKLENLNLDIMQKVKKDLTQESTRILEEFRMNLRNSITLIQEQMREKVDKFNLDDFSRKLDLKIVNEFSKKLDRSDLNKNTSVINKKVRNYLNLD